MKEEQKRARTGNNQSSESRNRANEQAFDFRVWVVGAFFRFVSRLPFCVLYTLSDIAYLFVYKLFGYRQKIVNANLTSSFPEKSKPEIKAIETAFYHWFCDYFFESIKLLTISDAELRKRFCITNSEEIVRCFEQGQNVAAILGHYCNWEWLSCVSIDLPKESITGLIYHPLRNKAFNELFKEIRSHESNSVPIEKNAILRYLVRYKQKNIRNIFGYIADQSPKWENIHLWLPFLNHDTPVFTGAEKIMRKANNAVYYVEMNRPKRGYYTATYHLITKSPDEMPEYEITKQFFRMLEQTIRNNPAYYLWSHNRWKRSREEFDRDYKMVNGKVIRKDRAAEEA